MTKNNACILFDTTNTKKCSHFLFAIFYEYSPYYSRVLIREYSLKNSQKLHNIICCRRKIFLSRSLRCMASTTSTGNWWAKYPSTPQQFAFSQITLLLVLQVDMSWTLECCMCIDYSIISFGWEAVLYICSVCPKLVQSFRFIWPLENFFVYKHVNVL